MKTDRRVAAGVLLAACCFVSSPARAQTFALEPSSDSLTLIAATGSDLLSPSVGAPAAGPLPLPVVGVTGASLGLLPGDVIDAFTYGNDAPAGALYFTVSRASLGVPSAPPEVATEATLVPPGTQPEASSDVFVVFDPAVGLPPGTHTQVLDGDGVPIGPLPLYGGYGLGLSEGLALPGPPMVDQIADFDWSAPGWEAFGCVYFSLAPGSPSLTPATNPGFPGGAEPGDIIASCSGFLFVTAPISGTGLVSGGPGCAPPACDDVDALKGFPFFVSLAPGSPSLAALPASPADVIDFTAAVVAFPAAALGLTPADDIKGLESIVNSCPAAPFSIADGPDGDGIAAACPDNCPGAFNPTQEDFDFDGVGDACDPCTDLEADGFGNPGFPGNFCPTDLCPFAAGPNGDADADTVGDVCDNCPLDANVTQADTDFDSIGDACDTCTDFDGDGLGIAGDACGTDNCQFVFNPAQTDTDADTLGDDCDNCPADANLGQDDSDADFVGDTCDNCQADANFAQADADLDGAGDACDICTSGVAVTKPGLLFKKLTAGPGLQGISVKGTAAFAGAVPIPPVDVTTLGMRVEVTDLGNAGNVVVDHTIPAGLVPNACGPKDGWKQNSSGTSEKFSTITDSIPPGCVAGSSQGITKAASLDKTGVLKGVKHKLAGKTGTFSPLTGPFRVVVVYGGGAEEAAGQCSETTYLSSECVATGGGTGIKCKQ
jgi:hypothetical protein